MKKRLSQALEHATEEQRQQILQLWSLDGKALPEKAKTAWVWTGHASTSLPGRDTLLLQRVQSPTAARFVWAALSENEQRVLYKAVAPNARSGLTEEALRKKTQLEAEQLEPVVDKLLYSLLMQESMEVFDNGRRISITSSALKTRSPLPEVRVFYPFEESQQVLYAVGQEIFSTKSSVDWPLEKILSSMSEWQVREVRSKHGSLPDFYQAKREAAETITQSLLEMGDPLAQLSEMDAGAKELFQWLRQQKGLATMRDVRAHTKASGPKLYNLLEELAQYALAFTTFKNQEHILFIPQNLYASLGKSPKQTSRAQLAELPEPPAISKPAETIVLNDIATLIGAIYQQNIEPTQANKIPKRILTKLRPRLHGIPRISYADEDEYADMLVASAQQLRMVEVERSPIQGIKPRYKVGPGLELWLKMSQIEQTQGLLRYWLNHFQWKDIAGIDFEDQYMGYGLQIQLGREKIVEHMRKCQPNRWYSVESLLRYMWENDPIAMRHSPYMNKATLLKLQAQLKEYKNWRTCEGEIYIGMLSNVLYELGIVELGYHKADALSKEKPVNPDAFRLTDLGKASLAQESPPIVVPDQSQQHPLIVQPSFEVLLMQQNFPVLYQLLPFAQLDHIGMVSRLTLTRSAILRGLENGRSIDDILKVLETFSQKELPQNVVYTLHDWAKGYQEAKISPVLLLEVSSEAIATRLCGLRKLQEYEIRQVAPCILLISNEINLQTLKNLLEKEGVKTQLKGNFPTAQPSTRSYRDYDYYDY